MQIAHYLNLQLGLKPIQGHIWLQILQSIIEVKLGSTAYMDVAF